MHDTPFSDAPLLIQGRKFQVRAVPVLGADGQNHPHEIIVHPGAVVMLPLLDDDQVVLIRNHRVATGGDLWELPAGTREPDEPLDQCASRELIEETGYEARSIHPLLSFYSAPGFCTELLHAFLATELHHVGQQLEATERITAHVMGWDQTMQMVRTGEIRDAKTIAVLLYYHVFHRTQESA